MDKEHISTLITASEKNAIAVLLRGGFSAFTECRIEDVRELSTGRRRPTWRNQGRHDLVIAIRKLADRQMPEEEEGEGETLTGTIDHIEIDGNPIGRYPDITGAADDSPAEANTDPEPAMTPVAEMTKAELIAEAKDYPQLTGEHKMKVDELRAAVSQQRRVRRAILHRRFGPESLESPESQET